MFKLFIQCHALICGNTTYQGKCVCDHVEVVISLRLYVVCFYIITMILFWFTDPRNNNINLFLYLKPITIFATVFYCG